MASPNKQKSLLSSWKEISGYLNCGIRTCRRWENKYGLPVHRIEGAEKSPVYAYKEELDAWLKKKLLSHVPLKKKFRFPAIPLRQAIFVVLALVIIVLVYVLFAVAPKPSFLLDWGESNIIVSEARNERLSVWSFDGDREYVPTMTAKPVKFSRTVMDDIDEDGVPEIVALMNVNVGKKRKSRDESKENTDDVDNQKLEKRIYPVVLKKGIPYDWTDYADSVFCSDADYFNGNSWIVQALAVGDVDEAPGKEIVVTSGDRLAVFRYDAPMKRVRLLASRGEIIEGAKLNLWSVAIDRPSESEKSQIYIGAYLMGRAERSFLLILEMWDNWPVLKRVVPSDTWTVSVPPLCVGDVIEGGENEIVTARTRRKGDWDNAFLIGWDHKGNELFDFQIHEPQMTCAQFRPTPRMAVGDLTPHSGDEIVVITNRRDRPCELIVYRIEGLSLIELSRHHLDSRISRIFVANLDRDADNEIFIEGYCGRDPKGAARYFLEVFDYDGTLSTIWRREIKSKSVSDVSVSEMPPK